MEKLDARTGKSKWTYKVTTGVNEVYLISSEPAVIAVMAGGYAVTDLISLDDRGKARASIQPNRDHQVINCSETFKAVVETCSTIVVGEEWLSITTDDDIVAYDLGTGRTVFKFDSITGRRMYLLRMGGGDLIAYREAGNLSPAAAVVSLDPVSARRRSSCSSVESSTSPPSVIPLRTTSSTGTAGSTSPPKPCTARATRVRSGRRPPWRWVTRASPSTGADRPPDRPVPRPGTLCDGRPCTHLRALPRNPETAPTDPATRVT